MANSFEQVWKSISVNMEDGTVNPFSVHSAPGKDGFVRETGSFRYRPVMLSKDGGDPSPTTGSPIVGVLNEVHTNDKVSGNVVVQGIMPIFTKTALKAGVCVEWDQTNNCIKELIPVAGGSMDDMIGITMAPIQANEMGPVLLKKIPSEFVAKWTAADLLEVE